MNPHTNYLAVGVFLLLGVGAMVFLIVWLGQAGDTTPKASYVVQIRGAVNGLGAGSVVRYLGVDVGNVTTITLQKDAIPFVEVLIEIDSEVPVDKNTYATLVVQGVTGIANIDLGSRHGATESLAIHSSGVPLIPFRATGLSAALASSGDLTTDARRLLAQLNALTSASNLERIESTLANLDTFSSHLAARSEDIPTLLSSLKSAAAKLREAAAGAQSAIADDWPEIAGDLKATSANLLAASRRVDSLLGGNQESIDQLLGTGPDSLPALIANLNDAAARLSRLSTRLAEDPSRLVYRGRHDPVVAEP